TRYGLSSSRTYSMVRWASGECRHRSATPGQSVRLAASAAPIAAARTSPSASPNGLFITCVLPVECSEREATRPEYQGQDDPERAQGTPQPVDPRRLRPPATGEQQGEPCAQHGEADTIAVDREEPAVGQMGDLAAHPVPDPV